VSADYIYTLAWKFIVSSVKIFELTSLICHMRVV